MDETSRLKLPFILPNQAQKHVTHNEALQALDAVVQISVPEAALNAPPATPVEGERHIVGAAGTGAFAGHAAQLAVWRDGAWAFHAPRAGWLALIEPTRTLVTFDGTVWMPAKAEPTSPVAMLGVNASPDATNRFTVKSDASLFDQAGAGHTLKLNKATATATASCLFQENYSGRGEIGLTGDNLLHFKLSQNGTDWKEGLTLGLQGTQVVSGVGTGQPLRSFHINANYGELLFEDPKEASDRRRFNVFLYDSGTAFRGLNAAGDGGTIWLYARNATGEVGLGTLAPTAGFRLDVAGAVRCASLTQTSDARRKTVAGAAPGLDFVRLLNPVLYRWKEEDAELVSRAVADRPSPSETMEVRAGNPAGGRTHCGLLAQEVKAAADSLGFDFGGYKNTSVKEPDRPEEHLLDYSQLIAPLVRAVQELAARLEAIAPRP